MWERSLTVTGKIVSVFQTLLALLNVCRKVMGVSEFPATTSIRSVTGLSFLSDCHLEALLLRLSVASFFYVLHLHLKFTVKMWMPCKREYNIYHYFWCGSIFTLKQWFNLRCTKYHLFARLQGYVFSLSVISLFWNLTHNHQWVRVIISLVLEKIGSKWYLFHSCLSVQFKLVFHIPFPLFKKQCSFIL